MFTIHNFDYDCTKKCKLQQHGETITSALTKRCIAEDKLAAFIAKTCRNFAEVLDYEGRSALHVACSVDQYRITEWLLNHGAFINGKDVESGSTGLHRAIFYGCIDCAVLLLQYGANIDAIDSNCRNPLQYICKPEELEHQMISEKNEVLVWGTNKNYNLGVSNGQDTSHPQLVDYFRKENIWIRNIAMSTYHSLFVDRSGNLYTVGHGKGGRLGNGSENSLTLPERIRFSRKTNKDHVISISCSRNHSLILTNTGFVYSCGLNFDQQLGIKPAPEQNNTFKEVSAFVQFGVEKLIKVIAKDHHSIAYNDQEIYVWGANLGQFGLKNTISHLLLPTSLSIPEKRIKFVESCNSAIVFYTQCNQIYLFHNYKMKSLKAPNMEPLDSICISETEKNTKNIPETTIRLAVLTKTKVIYIWYEDLQQYLRCSFSFIKYLQVEKILLKQNDILVILEGDVYHGKLNRIPVHNIIGYEEYKETYSKNEISTKFKVKIDLKRIPNIDRAVDIFCDDDFESFGVLQESSLKYYPNPKLINEEYTFKNLLHEVSEFDNLHDIIFHVDNEIFPSHKFIIFSRSNGLMNIVKQFYDKDIYLNFTGLTAKMFEFIMKYIYSNYNLTLDDLEDIQRSIDPSFERDRSEICDIFLSFAIKFELDDFTNSIKRLNGAYLPNNNNNKQRSGINRLKHDSFTNLYDITIKCARNEEIPAHKCVLVAQLEYFRIMLNNTWSETNIVNFPTIPIEYMKHIVDFLYTGNADQLRIQKYSENFLYNMMIICDQLFINNLKKICEILILEKLSIRKCAEILEFSCEYNCQIMEKTCLTYICHNLARIIEQRCLDICSRDVLRKINIFYREMYKHKLDYRIITPDSSSIPENELLLNVQNFYVDLDYKMNEDKDGKVKSKGKMNKSEISKRNYEREAISSLKLLSLDPSGISLVEKEMAKCEIKTEIEKISGKLHSKSESWMKVSEKKDLKRKSAPIASIKVNDILKEENKPKEEFISLNNVIKSNTWNLMKPIESPQKVEICPSPTNRAMNFNLADFTPKKSEKMSQKLRKRLSSESNQTPTISKPIPIPQQDNNPWTKSQSSSIDQGTSFSEIMKSSSPTKILPDNTEKRKSIDKQKIISKSFQESYSPPPKSKSQQNTSSFTKILENERKQKEYYDKIKSKSLILTQIEETAIDELKAFYNIENVEDENIYVKRKCIHATMNFAVWQHN